MKKYFLFIILWFLSFFCYSEELLFAIGEWPPYTSADYEDFGVAAKIVALACEEAGIKPVFKFYP
jgi:hypothetical protein